MEYETNDKEYQTLEKLGHFRRSSILAIHHCTAAQRRDHNTALNPRGAQPLNTAQTHDPGRRDLLGRISTSVTSVATGRKKAKEKTHCETLLLLDLV